MVDYTDTFGFELLQKLCDDQITKKEDVIVLLVHWYIIKKGFRCIGVGDSKSFDPSEKGSELLPEGWHTRPNYALRYLQNGELYILHGTKSDEDLLFNLLAVKNGNLSNVQFLIGQTVSNLHGPLESLIPSYQKVLGKLQKDLIDPLHSSTAPIETPVQRSRRDSSPDPLRIDPPRPHRSRHPLDMRPDIGRSDLDPLATGGSGMIFDIFSPALRNPRRPDIGLPERLPPAAVPPGARFDPFGPPGIGRPRMPPGPDNDHMPPPGYEDMFM